MRGVRGTGGELPALIGDGSHGADIRVIAAACGVELDVYDDAHGPKPPHGLADVYLGVNHPFLRARLASRFPRLGRALVHPSVTPGPGCAVGAGCVVAPGVVMLHRVVFAPDVHVNYGATMTRTMIGEHSTVAPGVTICGDVKIGPECFIGAGATICNLVTIGEGVTVGAGAVVTDDVEDFATVVGVPARPL